MGNCCTKTTGTCLVCMYECNTKICRCSYAHKECARKLVDKKCNICNQKYKTRCLQSVPQMSNEERQTLMRWKKMRQVKLRCEYNEIKQWTRDIFPIIISFYKQFLLKPRNVNIAIETIMKEENKFVQYAMNRGFKRNEVNQFLEKLYNLKENYNYLPKKTQTMVKKQLINEEIILENF